MVFALFCMFCFVQGKGAAKNSRRRCSPPVKYSCASKTCLKCQIINFWQLFLARKIVVFLAISKTFSLTVGALCSPKRLGEGRRRELRYLQPLRKTSRHSDACITMFFFSTKSYLPGWRFFQRWLWTLFTYLLNHYQHHSMILPFQRWPRLCSFYASGTKLYACFCPESAPHTCHRTSDYTTGSRRLRKLLVCYRHGTVDAEYLTPF